jgi:hypothetical protein
LGFQIHIKQQAGCAPLTAKEGIAMLTWTWYWQALFTLKNKATEYAGSSPRPASFVNIIITITLALNRRNWPGEHPSSTIVVSDP